MTYRITTAVLAVLFMVWEPAESLAGPDTNDYSHIPVSETFDVITWNIEWFGHETRGPDDTERQYQNVVEIIDSLQPDLIGVQEIYSSEQFVRLMNDLEDYDGFITGYGWGGDPDADGMDVGFIYNTNTVSHSHDRILDDYGFNARDWAYRFPLEFVFRVRIGQESIRMHAVVVHAKAFSNQEDYERRLAASRQIKNNYFDTFLLQVPLIYLGDYNDNVTGSTADDHLSSPYHNFVDDPYYEVISKPLEEAGEASWPGTGSRFPATMLDHITVNRFLAEDWWMCGSEQVYRPDYITDYTGTTSDHYPVYVRFDITGEATSIGEDPEKLSEIPRQTALLDNYPNPFNPVTSIPFRMADPDRVTLTVYDTMGRRMAEPIRGRSFSAGEHTVKFDASELNSGIYFYRLKTEGGSVFSRSMMLVK